MKDKIKKDANAAKNNKRLILTMGILISVVGVIYLISIIVGGSFRDFCENALIWVLMALAWPLRHIYESKRLKPCIKHWHHLISLFGT